MAPPKAVPNNKALNEYLERCRQAQVQGLEDPPISIATERALNAGADLYDAWLKTRSYDSKKLNDSVSAQAEVARRLQNSAY